MVNEFEMARKKYCPEIISCIFLAEAPPREGSKRFFYFEDVPKYDILYRQTMQALYPGEFVKMNKKEINDKLKSDKRYFLTNFCREGFYLMDASLTPMPAGAQPPEKRKILKTSLPKLIHKIQPHVRLQTPIILIALSVFEVCYQPLLELGLNILNKSALKFPIGYQPEYKIGIINCLKSAGLRGNEHF